MTRAPARFLFQLLLIGAGVALALGADAWFGAAAILLALVQPWLSHETDSRRRTWIRWVKAGVWIFDLGLWIGFWGTRDGTAAVDRYCVAFAGLMTAIHLVPDRNLARPSRGWRFW